RHWWRHSCSRRRRRIRHTMTVRGALPSAVMASNADAVKVYWEACWNGRRTERLAEVFHDPYIHGRTEVSPARMAAIIDETVALGSSIGATPHPTSTARRSPSTAPRRRPRGALYSDGYVRSVRGAKASAVRRMDSRCWPSTFLADSEASAGRRQL